MSYLTTVKILDFFEKVNFWPLLLLLPLLGGIAGLGGSRQNFFLKPRLRDFFGPNSTYKKKK